MRCRNSAKLINHIAGVPKHGARDRRGNVPLVALIDDEQFLPPTCRVTQVANNPNVASFFGQRPDDSGHRRELYAELLDDRGQVCGDPSRDSLRTSSAIKYWGRVICAGSTRRRPQAPPGLRDVRLRRGVRGGPKCGTRVSPSGGDSFYPVIPLPRLAGPPLFFSPRCGITRIWKSNRKPICAYTSLSRTRGCVSDATAPFARTALLAKGVEHCARSLFALPYPLSLR